MGGAKPRRKQVYTRLFCMAKYMNEKFGQHSETPKGDSFGLLLRTAQLLIDLRLFTKRFEYGVR